MNSHTSREIGDLLSIGSNESFSHVARSKWRIVLPAGKHEPRVSAHSPRNRKENAAAVWVILILVLAIAGSFWATTQLCGLLAERMQEMQRQRISPQAAYSELWKQGPR